MAGLDGRADRSSTTRVGYVARSAVISYEEAKAEGFRALERAAKKVTRRLTGRVRRLS